MNGTENSVRAQGAQAAQSRTISRGATRQIASLKAKLTLCKVYTLENYFTGRDVPAQSAWDALERHHAKLRDNGNGKYAVHVHSNCWYELREGPATS